MKDIRFNNVVLYNQRAIAKTILAGCYKFGAATLMREGGATMTSIIEIHETT